MASKKDEPVETTANRPPDDNTVAEAEKMARESNTEAGKYKGPAVQDGSFRTTAEDEEPSAESKKKEVARKG